MYERGCHNNPAAEILDELVSLMNLLRRCEGGVVPWQ